MTDRYQTCLTAAVGIALLATTALAQPPGGRRRGGATPPQPPAAQAPERRGGPPPLDEKQREALRALRQQAAPDAQSREEMRKLRQQLQELLAADTLETGKIEALKQEIAAAQAKALSAQIDRQVQVAKILTPEQRRALRERRGPAPGFGLRGRGPFGGGRGLLGPMGRGPGAFGRVDRYWGPGGGRGFGFMGPGGGRGFGPFRRGQLRQMWFGPERFMGPRGPWGRGRGFMGQE